MNMALVNWGYLHYTDINKFLKIVLVGQHKKKTEEENWLWFSQIQVSDPDAYWPSCSVSFVVVVCKCF